MLVTFALMTIVSVGPVPTVGSGLMAFYTEIKAEQGGVESTFYQVYLGEGDLIPSAGQTCDITFEESQLSGVVSGVGVVLPRAKIITKIRCGDLAEY